MHVFFLYVLLGSVIATRRTGDVVPMTPEVTSRNYISTHVRCPRALAGSAC